MTISPQFMVQLKIILDTRRKKSDGTYSVFFRITNVKKVNYLSSGISLLQRDWDEHTQKVKRSHPNHNDLNLLVGKRYYEIQKAIVKLETDSEFSFEGLKRILNPLSDDTSRVCSFNEFSAKLIREMLETNKTGNALVYQTASMRFIAFAGNRELEFRQIDYNLLEAFRSHLIKEGIRINSISNYFRTIRAIYNKAIKAKLVGRESYPFYDISIKSERTAKRAVSMDDVVKIARLELEVLSAKWHARNYFLLSLTLIGMSFTDLAYLKPSNIRKGRVGYTRRKTHKSYSIKLTPLSKQILDFYKSPRPDSEYLLPILSPESVEDSLACNKIIRQWIKTTNKWLKVIGKECNIDQPLTTYVARHTWATTARRLGYSNEMIGQALGHEFGNKITNIYLDHFDTEVIDQLNERVMEPLSSIFL